MKVLTRSGVLEEINFNRIKERLSALAKRFNLSKVDPDKLTQQVVSHIYNEITTYELDEHASRIAASWGTQHPEYLLYAAVIAVDNLHRETNVSFSKTVNLINKNCEMLNESFVQYVNENADSLDSMIDYERDFVFDFIGFQTLYKSYLIKLPNGKNCERPQHLYMRVATNLHMGDLDKIKSTYDLLSQGYYTHATPTLFNAGTINQQLASCFLKGVDDDIENIFKSLSDCAQISRGAGGIGIHIHEIRASGTPIKSTNGRSNGIIPMIQVYNATARYVDQGGGKRKGSIAIYLEPWHADIREFLELKKNAGDENMKARDVFLALWVPDLFMERVKNDEIWSLMCPHQCPGLANVYGDEFKKLYEQYEEEKRYKKQVQARDLFKQIMESQIETGVPYMCYKDSVNRKSNQKNLGVIRSSNLCVAPETLLLTDKGYYPIKSLVGNVVRVWNGQRFSSVRVEKTNNNTELIRVSLSNGCTVDCTPYHKFYTKAGRCLTAMELTAGTMLETCSYPICTTTDNFDITGVPINRNLEHKVNWLSNLFMRQGNDWRVMDIQYTYESTALHSENESFIYAVKYLLNTMGSDAVIKRMNNYWVLVMAKECIHTLEGLGVMFPENVPRPAVPMEKLYVVEVRQTQRYDETYCVNEPMRHKVVFNGVLTGQCSEIMEYSSSTEYAVCNLASINLRKFVKDSQYDFELLRSTAYTATRNLDRVIDLNKYPTKETSHSNLRHRPVGLGVQGLADVFYLLKMPFDSKEAQLLNMKIFETIYFGAVEASADLAQELGTYETYEGSYFSEGKLQQDLWEPLSVVFPEHYPSWDWEKLRTKASHGMRNSLLTCIMPTASTSQIMGNYECIEPPTSNIFVRKTLAGQFTIINKYLVEDLEKLGLWHEEMKDEIIFHDGSIQKIDAIPQNLKNLYKTVWEIPQKSLVNLAVDRSRFIDQSQSLNLFLDKPDFQKLYNCHMYGWKEGLKTGMYYLRTKPAVSPIKFSLGTKFMENKKTESEPEECLVCSS